MDVRIRYHPCQDRRNLRNQIFMKFVRNQLLIIKFWSTIVTSHIYVHKQVYCLQMIITWKKKRNFFCLEAVTFFGNQERDRNLYTIPGLDYVAHEDVIPYTVMKDERQNERERVCRFLEYRTYPDWTWIIRQIFIAWFGSEYVYFDLNYLWRTSSFSSTEFCTTRIFKILARST